MKLMPPRIIPSAPAATTSPPGPIITTAPFMSSPPSVISNQNPAHIPTSALYSPHPSSIGDIIGKNIGAPLYDNIRNAVKKLMRPLRSAPSTSTTSAYHYASPSAARSERIRIAEIGAAATASALMVGCATDGGLSGALTDAILFKAIGGFGIFMLGLDLMKDGLRSVSGNTLESIIGTLTRNRWASLSVGTGVTAIVQSSSVTAVTTIGLVDAGLMNLYQGMGVVIGANIGTTMTGWLFALKVAKYGLPIIGISALPFFFANNDKIKNIGRATLGLGMVFLGLETMSAGFKDPAIKDYISELFASLRDPSYWGILKCMLAGMATTAIVQSSSATLGITMALAKAGVIPFEAAAALVLGENVGTTATALLAALRPGTLISARRVAYAHFLFNFLSAFVLIYPASPLWIEGMRKLTENIGIDDPAAKIAFTHTVFNVAAAMIFISILPTFERMVKRLAPDRKPQGFGMRRLSENLLKTPLLALKASHGVITEDMNERVERMLTDFSAVLAGIKKPEDLESVMRQNEEDLDEYQRNLYRYFNRIEQGGLSPEAAAQLDAQRHMTGQSESIGDHLLKLFINRKQSLPTDLSEEAANYLTKIHEDITDHFLLVSHAVERMETESWSKIKVENDRLKALIAEHEEYPLVGSPAAQIFYRDMIALYKDILGNIKNIAEALAGKK